MSAAIQRRLELPEPQRAEQTELHPELNRAHVRFINLGKTYNGQQGPVAALHGIDLAIQRGEVFGIIGRSGAGKSSLIRTLNRLEQPSSGRGLQLLAKAGLITLKPGVGYKATEDDIVANPRKLKILQVEAVQLVRAYDDADLVQGYPAYIRLANTFDATSALLFDGLENKEYVIQFVIRPQNKDDPRLARFIDIYQHSPAVRAALDKAHGSLYQRGWES